MLAFAFSVCLMLVIVICKVFTTYEVEFCMCVVAFAIGICKVFTTYFFCRALTTLMFVIGICKVKTDKMSHFKLWHRYCIFNIEIEKIICKLKNIH